MELQNLKSFNPRECISGKMMRLNRVTASIFRKYLSPFGVTDSQLTLLFILTKRNDLNQKQLADFAKLEKSSLNRNLKRLITANYVTKENFPLIIITTKGKLFVNDIIPAWKKAMNEIEALLENDGSKVVVVVTIESHPPDVVNVTVVVPVSAGLQDVADILFVIGGDKVVMVVTIESPPAVEKVSVTIPVSLTKQLIK